MAGFVSQLNAVASAWVESVWAVLWQSTIVVVVVALLAAVLLRRTSYEVRYCVWQMLALKRLLMPFWTYAVPLPWTSPRPPPADAAADRPLTPLEVADLPTTDSTSPRAPIDLDEAPLEAPPPAV